ncbi:MAG: amino acid transporter [Nitrospirae bacterium GWD2_57_9]|nr:MAG: amino acid transporter [Nitrospirae bacterium GWD2_57_9]
MLEQKQTIIERVKTLILGSKRNLEDTTVFHKLTLIAFFAWVGLGADGLSSSCYGPEETFLALGEHLSLSVFVALMSGITVLVIAASYSQIIELFPTGGGGYLVASKLLSPSVGMVSGSALLIDYVLTITISVASGADALFSFLPPAWHPYKIEFAIAGVLVLTLMNMRGVRESVLPLVPIFLTFVFTHAFIIVYALVMKAGNFGDVARATGADLVQSHAELGTFGVFALLLRAYSMGAGTYTGIEAVSNGLPILREPKVVTGKRTMRYMAVSLAITVMGLILAYLLYRVTPQQGKTLNAVLFETMTRGWGGSGTAFVFVALLSEATLLLVAAQAGFLDGPRVLANMALDRWFPTKFAMLSDRLVTKKGILMMGGAALVTMVLTKGSVKYLVVLYSINVFITFFLSQLGMVRHWWQVRKKEHHWEKKLFINGVGMTLTFFILVTVIVLKFHEGGWITLLLTGGLVSLALFTRRHYRRTYQLLKRLDDLVTSASPSLQGQPSKAGTTVKFDPREKTAVLLVNGFNGLGLHTLFSIIRLFGGTFRNFVFVQVGIADAGSFKGAEEVSHLKAEVKKDLDRYVNYMRSHGYYAAGYTSFGTDVVDEIDRIMPEILERFPNAVLFGGQLVFPKTTFFSNLFHNYTIFAVQRRFYSKGIPVVVLPIRV